MMRAILAALVLLALAPFASAQTQASLVAALEAQYRAAIVRERRLADERELGLIAEAETRMRGARATLAAAQGDRAAAERELETARAEYVRLVNEVELLDSTGRIEVEAFRAELENRLPEATPELLAAYREFADGDRASAWGTLEPLLQARANARVAAARAVAAAEVRQLAQLREIMRLNGEATIPDVLALWDQAASLDASDARTHTERAMLAQQMGDLVRAGAAADAALAAARTPPQERLALLAQGDVAQASGEIAPARQKFEQALAITRALVRADFRWDGEVSVDLMRLGDVLLAQGAYAEARAHYEEALVIRRGMWARDLDPYAERAMTIPLDAIGDIRKAEGDFSGALDYYRRSQEIVQRLLVSDPNSLVLRRDLVVATSQVGDVQLDLNEIAAARQSYEQALTLARQLVALDASAELIRDLAVCLVGLGEAQRAARDYASAARLFDEAATLSRRAAEADPTNALRQSELAMVLERVAGLAVTRRDHAAAQRTYEETLALRRRIAALDASSSDARYAIAVSLFHVAETRMAQNDGDGAAPHYEESLSLGRGLLALNPRSLDYQRLVIGGLLGMGDMDVVGRDLAGAEQHYGEALAMRRAIAQAHRDDESAQRDVANSLYRMALWLPNGPVPWSDVVDALEALERRGWLRAEDAPVLEEARAGMQWAHCENRGASSSPEVQIGGCTGVIQSGRETSENAANAFNNRGAAYFRQRDHARAIADFNQAIALNPQLARAFTNRGAVYGQQGDFARALADFDQAIQLNPNDANAVNARALTYLNQRDFARAAVAYDQAVALNPQDAGAHNSSCWARAALGQQLDQARVSCDASLRIEPNNAATLDSRGMVGLKQQRWQEAWNDYDAAARIDATRASYFYGRGVAALRLGRVEEGQSDIAHAARLDATIAQTYAGLGVTP